MLSAVAMVVRLTILIALSIELSIWKKGLGPSSDYDMGLL